jgi:hypothetical protein
MGPEKGNEQVSRRGLLQKAGGALAAGVAGAAVGNALSATSAGAATGQTVLLGQGNDADRQTGIGGPAGSGNFGGNAGVWGHGAVLGVKGTNYSSTGGVGVQGETDYKYGKGVFGKADGGTGDGTGVHGITKTGVGVRAEATDNAGFGLNVVGRALFSRSGRVAFAQGEASKTITVARIDVYSIVLATIQASVAGTWVQGATKDVANARFTISLNQPAPTPLVVGWFVVN